MYIPVQNRHGSRDSLKLTGNHVRLSGKKDGECSFIAEGVETGLSVTESVKNAHVVASLGKNNMKNVSPDVLAKTVVLIADNDCQKIEQDKAIMQAAEKFTGEGKNVHIVMPEKIGDKTDMNDVLLKKGVEAVKDNLAERSTDFNAMQEEKAKAMASMDFRSFNEIDLFKGATKDSAVNSQDYIKHGDQVKQQQYSEIYGVAGFEDRLQKENDENLVGQKHNNTKQADLEKEL